MSVLIVGAGLAGLTAGAALRAAGRDVILLDKGRRPGGRAAQRDADVGAFEHGLPWIGPEADDPHFGGFRAWTEGRRVAPGGVGPWTAALAAPLAPRQGVQVTRIEGGPGGWRAVAAEGAFAARDLILTVPPAQAASLLPAAGARLGGVEMLPCWTLMAGFGEATGIDPARASPGDRAIPEHAKPDRAPAPERWTLQVGMEASRAMLETDRADAVAPLLERLGALAGGPIPDPIWARAHRWRYAACARPLGADFLEADGALLGGDWAPGAPAGHAGGLAGGAAAAMRSGRAMAAALLAR